MKAPAHLGMLFLRHQLLGGLDEETQLEVRCKLGEEDAIQERNEQRKAAVQEALSIMRETG